MPQVELNKDGNNKYALYSNKSAFQKDVFLDFGDYTMKIGKHKGKTLNDLRKTKEGTQYLYWFKDNIINDTNEKFYGKIIRVVNMMRDLEDLKKTNNL